MRNMGFYLFGSVKGGVGKSTLAVLTTKLLANRGRHPVLLDSDLLGSSLADGLSLCAPVMHDGPKHLEQPPSGQWHDLAQTRQLRDVRKRNRTTAEEEKTHLPPFLNDALLFQASTTEEDCRVDSMLWRHESGSTDRYLPSSPIRQDAMEIAPFITGNDMHYGWLRRITWIIESLVSNSTDITDIIIDLPPGTWALSHEALVLAGKMEQGLPAGYPQWEDRIRWTSIPTIVTTPDRNDRLLAVEYWLEARRKIPRLAVLMNRMSGTITAQRSAIRDDLPVPLASLGLEEQVRFVPNLSRSLGQLFVGGALALDPDLHGLSDTLRLQSGELGGR